MSTTIVILTILGGILQDINCLTVEEVLAEYKPKVKDLQIQTYSATEKYINKDNKATYNIKREKINATCIINKKIADLKDTVKELDKNATSEGIDTLTCVKNFRREIQHVYTSNSLDRCSAYNLHKAWFIIYKLQGLLFKIGQITDFCLIKFPDDFQSENLKECFEDSLKNKKVTLKKHKTSFEEAFKSALEKIRKCITEAKAKLMEVLEKIWANFENCVQNAKPPSKYFLHKLLKNY